MEPPDVSGWQDLPSCVVQAALSLFYITDSRGERLPQRPGQSRDEHLLPQAGVPGPEAVSLHHHGLPVGGTPTPTHHRDHSIEPPSPTECSPHAVLSGEFSKDITPMAPGPLCEANQCSFSIICCSSSSSWTIPSSAPADGRATPSTTNLISVLFQECPSCALEEKDPSCADHSGRSVGRMISNDVVWMVTGQHDIDLTSWIGHAVGRRI
ncbi:hypothetical protein CDAR_63001 [Caerostris darwini]|uniref:Uncharacterized protein n=1 Tax=Caerostris darwini TaxID=1538125 RepID=A0AAV4UFB7_9ARAC|nr:hypothetical protein CDAR_63001 [Caerostris darwini]